MRPFSNDLLHPRHAKFSICDCGVVWMVSNSRFLPWKLGFLKVDFPFSFFLISDLDIGVQPLVVQCLSVGLEVALAKQGNLVVILWSSCLLSVGTEVVGTVA